MLCGQQVNLQEIKMEWVPIVFIAFKVLVFGTGMFFSIKWHYDQDQKNKKK